MFATDADSRRLKDVAVIGAGYVGLPLCLHLAKGGMRVLAVDIDEAVVRAINDRTAKVDEKEDFERWFMDPDVQRNLRAQSTPDEADAFVIAVPTPVNHDDKSPDLARPGSSERIHRPMAPSRQSRDRRVYDPAAHDVAARAPDPRARWPSGGHDVLLAHCPERILPGNIMAESVYNARVVGGVDPQSTERAAALFGTFVKGKLHLTNDRTAEFVKLIENSYRDVNIAFANQVKMLCEELDIDAEHAIALANEHPRVQILNYGIGVGGHCIPVDPWFLVHSYPQSTALLRAAREVNDCMPSRTAARIMESVKGLTDPRVVCLGATYKPNVKDLRESPALRVFRELQTKLSNVTLFDPLVAEFACDSVLSAARGADALAILVPHDLIVTELQYRRHAILASMRTPNLLTFAPLPI